jgi:hypothetical protein
MAQAVNLRETWRCGAPISAFRCLGHERFQALDSSFHMMFDFVQHSLKAVSDCQRDMSIVSICQRPGAPMRFLMQSEVKLKPPV